MSAAIVGKHDSAPADLLDAARAGDASAIAALLVACQPDIRRYARRSCRSDDIDDAVQDAMFILHRRIGTLRIVAAFPAWLFEIVRRECLRLMRATARLVTFAPDEQASADAVLSSRPEVDIRMDVAAAIQSLPDHYRQVVLMRDIEEMTIDEIAKALHLTRESTKARLHRARAMVREYLKE